MRCSSLARECLVNGWTTQFCGEIPDTFITKLIAEGHSYNPAGSPKFSCVEEGMIKSLTECEDLTWVVLDGYKFGVDYQKCLLDHKIFLMIIDDYCHLPNYPADLIVNQNAGSDRYHYKVSRNGVRKIGPEYVLLRNEFSVWAGWERRHPHIARRILITAGGADCAGHVLLWLKAVETSRCDSLEIHVISGLYNSSQSCIDAFARNSRHRIKITTFTNDIPRLMAWADIALTGGGSTLLELAFMSLPSIVISLAENQRGGAHALASAGGCIHLGDDSQVSPYLLAEELFLLVIDKTRRRSIGASGRRLVDGHGAQRLRLVMENMH
jgi:spore coat polysaccharide biosynthesis predicted glycosyltransferase SpsG